MFPHGSKSTLRRAAAFPLGFLVGAATLRAQATEQEILRPPPVNALYFSGWGAIDASDDVLVVGAYGDHSSGSIDSGAVFVYRRDPATGSWESEQTLYASDPQGGSRFGWSVDVDGDAIVVGAPEKYQAAIGRAGAAYVFRRDASTGLWNEEQKLTTSGSDYDQRAGYSVAIEGDVVVLGAPGTSEGGHYDVGSAFVFRDVGAPQHWVEEQELVDPDYAKDYESGGRAVELEGGTLFVGCDSDERGRVSAGSVGVWTCSGGTWSQTQELVSARPHYKGGFGVTLAAASGLLFVGASGEGTAGAGKGEGAATLFSWDGAQWFESQRFDSPITGAALRFGNDLAVADDVLVIGMQLESLFGRYRSGAAWIYRRRRPFLPWFLDQEIGASDAQDNDWLGVSIAMTSDSIFVGSPATDSTTDNDVGAVYRFDAADLVLRVEPAAPAPGGDVALDVHRGGPGDPLLLALEDVDGVPAFAPLVIATFGADHAFHLDATVPDPALDLEIGLRAWKIDASGRLTTSERVAVEV